LNAIVEAVPFGGKLTPLRYARLARGLTQGELEDRAGLRRQSLARYENGHHRPGRLTRLCLARALDVDQEILFPDAEPVELPV
jgi:transcriptional regulator with XRE-family HTH domain